MLAARRNLRFLRRVSKSGGSMPELVPVRGVRLVSQTAAIARPKRRGALLASTAFTGAFVAVIAGHPTSALAACSGVNTANVLCDTTNQATAGTLSTTFAGTTTVNVNPGGKIDTGSVSATVTATGNLTFNHNDTTFGISGASTGVRLRNDFGAITYLGNASVTSTGSGAVSATNVGGAGDITITSNATATGNAGGIFATHTGGTGNILVTGSGHASGNLLNGINANHTGTSGGITISGSGNTSSNGNLPAIAATIFQASNASDILINRTGTVSGGIAANTTGTGNIIVTGTGTVTSTSNGMLLQATGGNVTVTNTGNTGGGGGGGIAGLTSGAGSVLITPVGAVTGSIGIIANASGTGTATANVSNDVTAANGWGVRSLTVDGLNTVNVTGGTIHALGDGLISAGISVVGRAGAVVNMTGGQISTAGARSTRGIDAVLNNATGDLSITSTSIFAEQDGITARLNGATSRNIAITANGVTEVGTGTGIVAIMAAGSTGNITISQNGAITGADGINVFNGGSGATTVTVNAPVISTGGIGVSITGGTGNTITNNSTINGLLGLRARGDTSVINRGTIGGSQNYAVTMSGANNTFTMEGPGAVLNGPIIGGGADTFRLAGSGSNSFNIGQIDTLLSPGFGLLDKIGASNWTLTGTATYAGPVTVREGTLTVNGSLASASGISVAAGATLGGSGTLPSTTINAGAALAPGNSIGAVNINGNLVFGAGAVYRVEVSPLAADRTNITGSATLTGATVQLTFSPGLYASRQYTILSATGGVGGTSFSGVSGANFNASLSYTPTDVLLNISPALGVGTPTTRNQQSVANAINAVVTGGGTLPPAFAVLFGFTGNTLGNALDQLSGEVHASTAGVLADESLYVRSAILGRLRQASYGGDMAAMAALSLGGPQVAFADGEPDRSFAYDAKSPRLPMKAAPAQTTSDVVFWAQGFGARGRFDGDGNAAPVRRDLAGVITGLDTRVGSNGRLGIAAGYTGARNALDGRGSANVETGHIAGYGGWSLSGFNLRAGGAYAFHSIATDRTIALPGFFDRAFANYDAHTGQVFGEFGYGFAFGNVAVEPFAGAAWVRVKTDAAAERGGLAALNIGGTTFETGYATLGIRAASIVPLAAGMVLIPRATLAWQHAFDTVTPGNVLALQTAPAFPFAISGVPIARDALLAEAGLDLAIGRNATIGVSYTGQIASNVQDPAAKGKFSWKF